MYRSKVNYHHQIKIALKTGIILILSASSLDSAADLIIGVQTHLWAGKRPIEKTLDMLSAAGVTSIRDEVPWGAVEKKGGSYSFHLNGIEW